MKLCICLLACFVAGALADWDEEGAGEQGGGRSGRFMGRRSRDDEEGEGRGRRWGRGKGGGRYGRGFMRDMPEEVQQQFRDIMHNDRISAEEKRRQALQLAQTVMQEDQLQEFERFSEKMAERERKREQQMAALSPNARAAAETMKFRSKLSTRQQQAIFNSRLQSLWHNRDISRDERREQKEAIMSTLSESEKAELESMRGHRGGRGGRRGLHGKSFMRDLPENVRQQFKDIMRDDRLNPQQKQQQSMQLAQSVLTGEQLEQFRQHSDRMAERQQRMQEKMAALSPNARDAAERMKDLWENRDMTWEQKKQQKEMIMQTLSESERQELEQMRGGRHGFGRGSGEGRRGFGGGRSGDGFRGSGSGSQGFGGSGSSGQAFGGPGSSGGIGFGSSASNFRGQGGGRGQ